MLVDVTKEERDVLLRWKKRSDSFVLVRLKAEAVLYASRGVDVSIIAEMVDRSQRTVRNWLARWRLARLCSVVTGHAGNENAAKLTRAQKEQLKETLGRPPSQSGIKADFWDVPALRDVVKIKFGVEYASDSSYQLLMRFLGMSFKLPDPFDKRRDEAAITARMAQIRQEVAEFLTRGTARSSLHLHPIPSIAAVRVRGVSPRRGPVGRSSVNPEGRALGRRSRGRSSSTGASMNTLMSLTDSIQASSNQGDLRDSLTSQWGRAPLGTASSIYWHPSTWTSNPSTQSSSKSGSSGYMSLRVVRTQVWNLRHASRSSPLK